MYNEDDIDRIKLILVKIDYILDICNSGIIKAMMHLTSIAEQFTKLKDKNILDKFDQSDIKGAIDTRNFIAHDYEGINLPIIEFIIRERLPIIKNIIEDII